MSISDSNERYGQVSRILHWGMALLLLWQFISAGTHVLLEDTFIEAFFWSTHEPLGFLLFFLAFVRVIWALANTSRRPPSMSIAATLGHLALYGGLVLTPSLALLRQYGAGRAFEPFGIPVFSGFEDGEIVWMVELGSLLHSWLGWVLLAMIVGHMSMVFWHKSRPTQTDVLPRMWR